jgi:hypothetical protein
MLNSQFKKSYFIEHMSGPFSYTFLILKNEEEKRNKAKNSP